jgi:hypothetical protein
LVAGAALEALAAKVEAYKVVRQKHYDVESNGAFITVTLLILELRKQQLAWRYYGL